MFFGGLDFLYKVNIFIQLLLYNIHDTHWAHSCLQRILILDTKLPRSTKLRRRKTDDKAESQIVNMKLRDMFTVRSQHGCAAIFSILAPNVAANLKTKQSHVLKARTADCNLRVVIVLKSLWWCTGPKWWKTVLLSVWSWLQVSVIKTWLRFYLLWQCCLLAGQRGFKRRQSSPGKVGIKDYLK